jgi:hypothetical protein
MLQHELRAICFPRIIANAFVILCMHFAASTAAGFGNQQGRTTSLHSAASVHRGSILGCRIVGGQNFVLALSRIGYNAHVATQDATGLRTYTKKEKSMCKTQRWVYKGEDDLESCQRRCDKIKCGCFDHSPSPKARPSQWFHKWGNLLPPPVKCKCCHPRSNYATHGKWVQSEYRRTSTFLNATLHRAMGIGAPLHSAAHPDQKFPDKRFCFADKRFPQKARYAAHILQHTWVPDAKCCLPSAEGQEPTHMQGLSTPSLPFSCPAR